VTKNYPHRYQRPLRENDTAVSPHSTVADSPTRPNNYGSPDAGQPDNEALSNGTYLINRPDPVSLQLAFDQHPP